MALSAKEHPRTTLYLLLVVLGASTMSACIFAAAPTGREQGQDSGNRSDTASDVVDSRSGSDVGPDIGRMDAGAKDTSAVGDVSTDGSGDAGEDTSPRVPAPEYFYLSSGGGTLGGQSASYRLQVSIGTPSPRGSTPESASSSNYRITLAPVSP